MRNNSLSIDILADALQDLALSEAEIGDVISLVKHELPSVSDEDAIKVFQLALAIGSRNSNDGVEIVATTPVSFKSKTRKTRPVIEELINGAEKSIQITGYSISDHFEDLLKLINAKSKRGVVVELFVNNYEKVRSVLLDIEHTNRRFFKVYSYAGKADDKMAALHAKTILVDGKRMLISSANLSYHGLDGNIELGALITSRRKVAQVQEIFSELKRQRIFTLME
jgi:phosphatidylserine/phosphatidylglycerophosphate/cardiolipin synthase-like enzyme